MVRMTHEGMPPLLLSPPLTKSPPPHTHSFRHPWQTGAAIYAFRLPERWSKSGRFDILLHSHQIFHISVVLAAFVHYQVRGLKYETGFRSAFIQAGKVGLLHLAIRL